ncbi:Gfo/Idh/MocA family protein [Paenibacillus cymbidii]|uniref:Gfo/Idh/MocA family protein n=1 Tax=Paenibacillus cymbidii TaxID=1639034 RepID=UPI0014367CC8|nr:Gfo/Idh/MocA family oxidoreductase [Paenibacillus cymbidii]
MKNENTIRAAVIGCGGLGKVHSECISRLEGMEVAAYADVAPGQAEALLRQFGGSYATDDPERIFQDATIDAVYVATQHDSHADLCIRALEAGKHVMVEKPLAMTVEDCLRIGETVRRTGGKLMTAFKMRYYDMLLKAKELIPQPLVVTMQMMDNRWANEMWANDPIRGGGNVVSQGCHSCDILRFVAGRDPVEVYAAGGNYYQSSGVVDNLTATFRFDGGAAGSWVQGDCGCPPLTSKFFMQLFAENKSITLSDRLTTLVYQETGGEKQVFRGTETGFLEENRAFLACLRDGTEPPIDHIDGLYATLMPLQAIRSLQSGKPEPIRALIEQYTRQPSP